VWDHKLQEWLCSRKENGTVYCQLTDLHENLDKKNVGKDTCFKTNFTYVALGKSAGRAGNKLHVHLSKHNLCSAFVIEKKTIEIGLGKFTRFKSRMAR
jgi:hypothetical protein